MILLGLLISGGAYAAGQAVPHSFQAGQKAVASEVNENFQNLADRIANLPGGTVLNASDFAQAATITGKNFTVTNSANANPCTADNRTYTRSGPTNGVTTIVETATLSGGSSCNAAVTVTTVEVDATGSRVTQIDTNIPANAGISPQVSAFVNTQTFTPKLLFLPAQVSKDVPYTTEVGIANTLAAVTTRTFIALFTLVGLEDVTVPAGAFTNCLKIHRMSNGSTTSRMEWRCAGVGVVKQVDSAQGILELNQIIN